MGVGSISITA